MSATSDKREAVWLLLVATIFWSFGAVIIKGSVLSPAVITGISCAVGAATQLLFLRGRAAKLSLILVVAAVCYSGIILTTVTAIQYTSAANAMLLQFTSPVFAALFGAAFLGEKPSKEDLLTITIVLAGMVLFFLDRLTAQNVLGNGLAILSGILVAAYVTLLRFERHGRQLNTSFLGNVIAAIVCFPFVATGWETIALRDLLCVTTLGIFGTGLGWVCYCTAIRHVRAVQALLIGTLEAILGPLLVCIFIGERPGWWSLCGGTLVCATVMWYGYRIIARSTPT